MAVGTVGAAMEHHLAQVNIGRLRDTTDSPMLADFMNGLDEVNAAAEAAPGYVWRLQTDEGNATDVVAFEWDAADSAGVITNLSTWTDVASLKAFVGSELHVSFLRRRAEWFHRYVGEAYVALWWVPAGTEPTPADAEERIRHLRAHGPTEYAFTLARSFPPPGAPTA